MGYCPFACAGSQYRELYHDTRLGTHAWARDRRRDTTGLACNRTLRHGQEALRHGKACACLAVGGGGGGGGGGRDTNGRIVTGGRPGCWVYRETGSDTAGPDAATRHPSAHLRAATRQGSACDTTGGATTRRGPTHDTTQPCARHNAQQAPCDTAPMRHDTAGARLRHSHDTVEEGPTIRPSACHDTARATTQRCAHGLGAACVQPGPWVCALCS